MRNVNKPSPEERPKAVSAWSPFRQSVFLALWFASVVSNIGSWMHNTAAAWLMTSIDPSPVMVALVQTATSLPIFLLALPAGALADILDRRRLIIFTQIWMVVAAAGLGWLTLAGLTNPWVLLVFTLLLGLGIAFNAPAWQAIVPELVSKAEIPAAVALNSAGFNVARSLGPALGGLVVGAMGAGAAFLTNAASFLGVIVVLFLWRRPPKESTLPAERMLGAMRTGIRYVRHAPALLAIFIHAGAFIISASALMALLPLLARYELTLDSVGYGFLLGSFGLGGVVGAAVLQVLRSRISVDVLVAGGTVLFGTALLILAYEHNFIILCAVLVVGGAAWLALLSSFNSSAQAAAPYWVRGRVLAVYMLVFFGGMAGGSVLWGATARLIGIPNALTAAACGLVAGLLGTFRFRLSTAERLDLTPSMHWPTPTLMVEPEPNDGPVLVVVEYRIDPSRWHEFGVAVRKLRRARLRSGAFRWTLFVDASDPQRYVESFIVESWVEHKRQHERVTVFDRELENIVHSFHTGNGPPAVTHFLARALPK
jgi:MFS family permease